MTAVIESLVNRFLQSTKHRVDVPLANGADFFARTGAWVTVHFAKLARDWTCYEINDVHRAELAENMPNARLVFADSFTQLAGDELFDVVLADCPQGLFGENGAYCEHFEFLPKVLPRLNDRAVIFFNVNVQPYQNKDHAVSRPDYYGMTDFDEWIKRRNAFYSISANERLSEDFIGTHYSSFFRSHGFGLDHLASAFEPSNLPGHPPFICRQIALLSRL